MPAPVAVLVEVDGEPVFQAYIAYCAICRGPTELALAYRASSVISGSQSERAGFSRAILSFFWAKPYPKSQKEILKPVSS